MKVYTQRSVLDDYVDLDRRFRRLRPGEKSEEAALESYTAFPFFGSDGLGWGDLLAKRLVVVLGEPGSGKTYEFTHQMEMHRRLGQLAFFIRLDSLVTVPLKEVLDLKEWKDFQKWKKRGTNAIFFLDSVDEAKIQKVTDFSTALRKFCRELPANPLNRAQIILSSRISEWRPETDSKDLLNQFQERPEASINSDGKINEQDQSKTVDLLVVQIIPLDRERVKRFTCAISENEANAFLTELDQSHAWEFARRPQDVRDLLGFFDEHGRLGSLTEIIEYSINQNLRDNTDRVRSDKLSFENAILGAKFLGAASILCRQISFQVPDERKTSATSLDPLNCLPDSWLPNEASCHLSRPLFESASYGRIRFHHRRVAEYLAAQWLADRMQQGCTYDILEDLLFDMQGSHKILRESLAPIAAWLCNGDEAWNREVRSWVLKTNPEIHLRYGDPSRLPLDYRRDLLGALVNRYSDRTRVWIEDNPESLKRFADSSLSKDISGFIHNRSLSADLRCVFLLLVRHGRVTDCLDAVLSVLEDPSEGVEIKCYAAAAIRDMGSSESRERLWKIVSVLTEIPSELCARLCEALYPEAIGPHDLIILLSKSHEIIPCVGGLPWTVAHHLESTLRPEDSEILLHDLLDLYDVQSSGSSSDDDPEDTCWAIEIIPVVLKSLLSKPSLTDIEIQTASKAFGVIANASLQGVRHYDNLDDLNGISLSHLEVRKSVTWECINKWRKEFPQDTLSYRFLSIDLEPLQPHPKDLQWLLSDIVDRPDPADQEIALRFSVEIWQSHGFSRSALKAIKKTVSGNKSLRDLLKRIAVGKTRSWLQQKCLWTIRWKFLNKTWWDHRWRHLNEKRNWLREQRLLVLNLHHLSSGKALRWLVNLTMEASSTDDSHHMAPQTWDGLRKKRGRLVVWATKKGCMRVWREFRPLLPHERQKQLTIDMRVSVGLAGIQCGVNDGEIDLAKFTDEESRLATRYAVNEMNGFPSWFEDLIRYHPQTVVDVFAECIKGEWLYPDERGETHDVLSRLVYYGDDLWSLIEPVLTDALVHSDPLNTSILRQSLAILLKHCPDSHKLLDDLSSCRLGHYSNDRPQFLLWMVVWLQIQPENALNYLETMISDEEDLKRVMVNLCSGLGGDRHEDYPFLSGSKLMEPVHLRRFIPLVYCYVSPSEDIDRSGGKAYSPTPRDDAQMYRNRLLLKLAEDPCPFASQVLEELLEESALETKRDWIQHLLDIQRGQRAEHEPWTPKDLHDFAAEYETEPKTDTDLYKITLRRLEVIKYDVEKADVSARNDLRADDKENRLRQWLARLLQERSRDRYTVPQEEEIDPAKKPDLRIENPRTKPISIELKWADNWTLEELLERLENQLFGQYLRAHTSRYGVYLLGMIGKKQHWKESTTGKRLTFEEVITTLTARARELVQSREDVEDVAVIGIDFRDQKGGT